MKHLIYQQTQAERGEAGPDSRTPSSRLRELRTHLAFIEYYGILNGYAPLEDILRILGEKLEEGWTTAQLEK